MLTVDNRVGSRHLVPLFKDMGLPVRSGRLKAGDVSFRGNGPRGFALIGVEVKRLDDLVQSFITKRLTATQLPAMLKRYQFAFLVVEGEWREDPDGMIQRRVNKPGWSGWTDSHSKLPWASVKGALLTFVLRAGLHVEYTRNALDTARLIGTILYPWFLKDWGAHQAHRAVNEEFGIGWRDSWYDEERYFPEKVAACVPGIGVEKAGKVAGHFRTVREMANASIQDWLSVRWRGRTGRNASIGPETAKKAWRAFRRAR